MRQGVHRYLSSFLFSSLSLIDLYLECLQWCICERQLVEPLVCLNEQRKRHRWADFLVDNAHCWSEGEKKFVNETKRCLTETKGAEVHNKVIGTSDEVAPGSMVEIVAIVVSALAIGISVGVGIESSLPLLLTSFGSVAIDERNQFNDLHSKEIVRNPANSASDTVPTSLCTLLTNENIEKRLLLVRLQIFRYGNRCFTSIIGDVLIGAVRNQ